jgi:hypothetical protein
MNTPPHRFLKWFSVIGASLTLSGLGGLLLAYWAYPGSNLLGEWALILGPLYWLGMVISLVSALAWTVVGLCKLRRKITNYRN